MREECERIWNELPCRFPWHVAGWSKDGTVIGGYYRLVGYRLGARKGRKYPAPQVRPPAACV